MIVGHVEGVTDDAGVTVPAQLCESFRWNDSC